MSWQSKRSMTASQFKRVIKELDMSISGAARFLGHSHRQGFRYLDGTAIVCPAEAMLLWGMLERGDKPVVPPWDREAS